MSKEFNPTLAYLYRRWLTRQLLWPPEPGRFLEIGVGSGNLYENLVSWGFSGLCLDLNPDLIQEHKFRARHIAGEVEFHTMDFFQLKGAFDLVVAFEVLEHYVDDRQCLERWRELLAPGGILLFSVPAHQRRWTANDSRAGHVRRYEKAALLQKLRAARFEVESFWCYGYPVLNWTYPLSSALFPGRGATGGQTSPDRGRPANSSTGRGSMRDYQRTSQSGARRFARLSSWLLREWLWRPVLLMQRPLLLQDLGTGYMVKCRKFGPGVFRSDFSTKRK